MKHPCSNCPWRKDSLQGWLGEGIEAHAQERSFVCHKTARPGKERKQCAGHMLLKKRENFYFKLAEDNNIDLELRGEELIFDSVEDAIIHHRRY